MISQVLPKSSPRLYSQRRKVVHVCHDASTFDPRDPLNSIREYRLRKVASKRIPSRIS